MFRKRSCKAMLGCHTLESRFDSLLQKRVHDYQVLARYFKNQNLVDETALHINSNNNRQYWNLSDTSESIELALIYNDIVWKSEKDLPEIICFAWCNSEMLGSAPVRNIDEDLYHVTYTAQTLQNLVRKGMSQFQTKI